MRGVILAGGTGSRLLPLTEVTNKHCLQIYDRPMVSWPLRLLKSNNITDITVVSSRHGIGQLAYLLGGGITYRVQDKPGGIANALSCAESSSREQVAVILGDNIFLPPVKIRPLISLAHCYLHNSPDHDLSQFGVAQFRENGTIESVIEKPSLRMGSVVTGLYVFDCDVFDILHRMSPSARGEVEITSVLNHYAAMQQLDYSIHEGFWGDAGTHEGLANCSKECAKCGY